MTKHEATIEAMRDHLFNLEFMLGEKEEEVHGCYLLEERELIAEIITLLNSLD
jgi:hypothetical protein